MGLAAAAAAGEFAEEIVEDVGEAAVAEAEAAIMHAGAVLEGGMPVAVIGRALLAVLQDVVSLVDFLELQLGFGITRIAIRVILHGQLAIGLLDDFVGSAPGDPESFIEACFRHGLNDVSVSVRRLRSRSS